LTPSPPYRLTLVPSSLSRSVFSLSLVIHYPHLLKYSSFPPPLSSLRGDFTSFFVLPPSLLPLIIAPFWMKRNRRGRFFFFPSSSGPSPNRSWKENPILPLTFSPSPKGMRNLLQVNFVFLLLTRVKSVLLYIVALFLSLFLFYLTLEDPRVSSPLTSSDFVISTPLSPSIPVPLFRNRI